MPPTYFPLATAGGRNAGCEHGRAWSFCRHRRPSRVRGASPLPAVPPRGPTCPSAHATQPASAPSPSKFCDRTGQDRIGQDSIHAYATLPYATLPYALPRSAASAAKQNRRGHSSPPKLQPCRAIRTLFLHVPLPLPPPPPITPIHAPFLHHARLASASVRGSTCTPVGKIPSPSPSPLPYSASPVPVVPGALLADRQ
ncbi:hypothetical protein COCMIDRAFT_24459 [Bipolaris oryzae ATCC 44560]|uniref:Uncharacterized protein n=1 Tax=Bipolaris oryzae ATCC 44560 TaxID=930090 RepID=W6ZUT0_COCMI|nr:uncharacterized protein COCMIDRAFT_24459 [Bipolaris oryzae ATCC 44560]EUC47586.1 hypothetical protein COCMIDRAFT_24459 [Bipolaris oryzae ATCC 44560]